MKSDVESLSYKDKIVFVEINQDYLNKLNISCINVTQLPMLILPNEPSIDGKYLPYILPEISHIYNSFDSIVKNKYNNRDKSENQNSLNKIITYLNKTRFKINIDI